MTPGKLATKKHRQLISMNTITVKIECGCRQHYSFDVEPTDGQMPGPIACPTCGVDGTSAANEIITRELSSNPPPARLTTTKKSTPATSGRASRIRSNLSEEDSRKLLEAKEDVKRAMSASAIVAGLDLLLAILSLFGVKILGADLWILLDVVVVGGLAYGIYRFSRTCAVLMCVYYLLLCILFWRTMGLGAVVVRAVFLYFFCRGAQATFEYHKLTRQRR